MNGPDHYREAERLVQRSDTAPDPEVASIYIGQAQVHASLAHVAAVIDAADQGADQLGWPGHAWSEATS